MPRSNRIIFESPGNGASEIVCLLNFLKGDGLVG